MASVPKSDLHRSAVPRQSRGTAPAGRQQTASGAAGQRAGEAAGGRPGTAPEDSDPETEAEAGPDQQVAGVGESRTPAGRAPVADPQAAAFFDVDNTVVRGASIYHLARGLYARDFFTMRDIALFGWQQVRFRLRGENQEQLEGIQQRALAFVAGHSAVELRAIGEEVYDELMADRLWPGTLLLARHHIAAGQRIWLVTATPVEVAEVIADRLGFSGALGTIAEHVDGIYTGQLVGRPMHGEVKAQAVRELAEREALVLSRCSAYSDSANDIPLLSLVGSPVAINPDARLRAHARENGWQIYDYRSRMRAAKIGVPLAAGTGLAAAALAGAVRKQRRRAQRWHL